ncbi:DNA helicase [Desulfopila sp. IMCC35006]|uniref:DnaB-like helicase C-terminal domain-containing protein n=1 Tax=Desulfopila sp. IMCC35006 TaxID=2569542 RepID=UPI0010ACA336|nr:DnaB-like helicase C-terminal domain-containing protein [Desulfopila sp. IMCC35006]TKB26679.1 DNA helicase [Desulfopila sp. IMCC35006]
MAEGKDAVSRFYLTHLKGRWQEKFSADCPFCKEHGSADGRLSVVLNTASFFHGYFRCVNRCVPGGFPLWFARLAGIPLTEVPEYDPDQEIITEQLLYPAENINDEIRGYRDRITDAIYSLFQQSTVSRSVLEEMQVGFNGRYLVYPYIQDDGNCYSARCVHPERPEDTFWHGIEQFSKEPHNIFNVQDIARCENGALFICEGEENLLPLKQLGFPGVAVSHYAQLERMPGQLFDKVKTLFICVANSLESENAARNLASIIGYKARILVWQKNSPRKYSLWQLARDSGRGFAEALGEMVKNSRSFSPFSSPEREYRHFLQSLEQEQGEQYRNLSSGFSRLDDALGGIHGINVIGGAPKVGKSTFLIQIGSEMALRHIPVLYYDFENGRQKIYRRTLSRLARLSTEQLSDESLPEQQKINFEAARRKLQKMLFFWRVINDRKVTPELMRKHIDFIRHETRSDYTVVVVDSLHKLPFNEFTERRTGIDAWLRQMESIRDELQVSFLVISELSRGQAGAYLEEPHLGVFKGSGDIEYSADNAMVLYPASPQRDGSAKAAGNANRLFLVASREHSPGQVAEYRQDFPYWGFTEHPVSEKD